ncbi:exodeoxyribonuclease VII small subunit [Salmonella enterica]|nr:exodeoxyribonuclease VII small subunit [Salmonella enterica]
MAKGAQKPSAAPTDTDEFADVAELSYEQARDELIDIVAQLEGGQVGLEESMRLWKRGEALAAHCSTWLDGAEAALTQDDPQ